MANFLLFAFVIGQTLASFDMWTINDKLPTSGQSCDEILDELNYMVCGSFEECNIRSCKMENTPSVTTTLQPTTTSKIETTKSSSTLPTSTPRPTTSTRPKTSVE